MLSRRVLFLPRSGFGRARRCYFIFCVFFLVFIHHNILFRPTNCPPPFFKGPSFVPLSPSQPCDQPKSYPFFVSSGVASFCACNSLSTRDPLFNVDIAVGCRFVSTAGLESVRKRISWTMGLVVAHGFCSVPHTFGFAGPVFTATG